jgi:hypothetical protein
MQAVRDIIHDQYLPIHLWEEAAKMTVYVKNKIPHNVLEKKDTRGDFFRRESKSEPFLNIWLQGQIWTLLDIREYFLVTMTH